MPKTIPETDAAERAEERHDREEENRFFLTRDVRESKLAAFTDQALMGRYADYKRKFDGELDRRRRAEWKREVDRTVAEIALRKSIGPDATRERIAAARVRHGSTKGAFKRRELAPLAEKDYAHPRSTLDHLGQPRTQVDFVRTRREEVDSERHCARLEVWSIPQSAPPPKQPQHRPAPIRARTRRVLSPSESDA